MSYDLEARVSALETVLDKYIPIITQKMAKSTSSKSSADPDDTPVAPSTPSRAPVGLVAPAYDVPYQGALRRVTAEILAGDPELMAYMRKNFPECFVK